MVPARLATTVTSTEFVEAFERAAYRLGWNFYKEPHERYCLGSPQREPFSITLQAAKKRGFLDIVAITAFIDMNWNGREIHLKVEGPDVPMFGGAHNTKELDGGPKTKKGFEEFLATLSDELKTTPPTYSSGSPD